jgi:hypothetical protein
MGYDQVPQLTSSRLIDVNKTMSVVPPGNSTGRRRAILIGINYTGQQGQLSGCHNGMFLLGICRVMMMCLGSRVLELQVIDFPTNAALLIFSRYYK